MEQAFGIIDILEFRKPAELGSLRSETIAIRFCRDRHSISSGLGQSEKSENSRAMSAVHLLADMFFEIVDIAD
jgi:hypothetical protein